jgi:hypothetical protein
LTTDEAQLATPKQTNERHHMSTTYAPLIPLSEALAAVDSPEAVSDRRKRARAWGRKLEGIERGQMISRASRTDYENALAPHKHPDHRWGHASEAAERGAADECGRNFDELVARECEKILRDQDIAAVHNQPDRLEESRIWNLYTRNFAQVARMQGNKEHDFIRRWKDLIAARNDALEYGDSTAAIEGRLERLVGMPYPTLPEAAWNAAETLPTAEREIELVRLEQKYGPRQPDATPSAPTRRRRVRA